MIRSSSLSDPGRVHDLNEDSIGVDDARAFWLVADGVGGHAAGEVASRIACDVVMQRIAAGADVRSAAIAAHDAVVHEAGANAEQKGMGSTLVALRIADATAEFTWVGDSRGYLYRAGQLRRTTKDHSFMQMLIDQQHLTEEQARTHPRRNVVTQVLGYGTPEPDVSRHPLRAGDVLLLCSDGLYDELTDAEIADVLGRQGDNDEKVRRLIGFANERGGRDNISVVVVSYDGPNASGADAGREVDPNKTTMVRGRTVGKEQLQAFAEERSRASGDGARRHLGLLLTLAGALAIAGAVFWTWFSRQ
ncbi:MAG: protein phosphatase 2C domain-containing protein [Pseudomonadales bacterium]